MLTSCLLYAIIGYIKNTGGNTMRVLKAKGQYLHEEFGFYFDDLDESEIEVLEIPKISKDKIETIGHFHLNNCESIILDRKDVEIGYIENYGFVSNLSSSEDLRIILGDINRLRQILEEEYSSNKYGYRKQLSPQEQMEAWKCEK